MRSTLVKACRSHLIVDIDAVERHISLVALSAADRAIT